MRKKGAMILMKKTNMIAKGISILLLVLMLGLLVLQFVPYWSFGEDASGSIGGYIWLPSSHKGVNNALKAEFGKDYRINQYLVAPIALLVSAAVGIVFSILKCGKIGSFLLPLICGISGVVTYFTYEPYKLGLNWIIHASLSIVVLAVAVIGIVVSIISMIQNKKKK